MISFDTKQKNNTDFLSLLKDPRYWELFFTQKTEQKHLSKRESDGLSAFIAGKRYLVYSAQIEAGSFPQEYPVKKRINKENVTKKRIVYTFSEEVNYVLKLLAFSLYRYDDFFSVNCYAFRRNRSVGHAIRHIQNHPALKHKYCYKADIRNYFNSIDPALLLSKLSPIRAADPVVYEIFERILMQPLVMENNRLVADSHGGMAGLPIAPFFANWYLKDVDELFFSKGISYFRYSDDILIFADTEQELRAYQSLLQTCLDAHGLSINPEKENVTLPHGKWEFLGFSYQDGVLDLSDNTKRKIKGKIHRKAKALRRWQRKKNLSPDKAAIGFIRAMNRKFYGTDSEEDFCWQRWFFPYLTVDTGLREIDAYMQEYIRYCVTGRHYKGNYRIRYEQLKSWGYRSLVHEYYKQRN